MQEAEHGGFEDDLVSMLDLDARAGPRRASTHVLFSQMHPYSLGARRQQAVWLHLGLVGAGCRWLGQSMALAETQ